MNVSLVESGAALQSMRNSDFDPYSAYGEIVDNSIQANAKNIDIHFEYQPATNKRAREAIEYLVFTDDGDGMKEDVLHRCLQLGYSSRYNDRSGIGRFGVGAILASINQCMKIEIFSKIENGDWLYTFVDLEKIIKGEMDNIPTPVNKTPPHDLCNNPEIPSGTIVKWSKYDRQPTDASEMRQEFHEWTGRTFRHFIWSGVKISINKEKVHTIDPLYATVIDSRFPNDSLSQVFDEVIIPWPIAQDDRIPDGPKESNIRIKMSLLPEEVRPNQGAGNAKIAIERFIPKNEGVSIIRNGREVFFGRIPYWPGDSFSEIDRWWGCEISFDAVLDKEFTVKNIKRGAIPVKELKKLLSDKIEPTRKTCITKVRELWAQAKAEKKAHQHNEGNTETGHAEAENAAKGTKTPKNLIDRGKDQDTEAGKAADDWAKHANKQEKTRWKEKFKGQPFTIVDDEWRGPEFFETAHLGGSSVLTYNMRHKFFEDIDEIRQKLKDGNADNHSAAHLKTLIDLLLMSYAKAEAMFDASLEMPAETFIEQIRMNWGNYLTNYIATYNKTNS